MPGTKNSGGRNAKGASEHRAAGTFRPDRHAGGEAPSPPSGRPAPPPGLSPIAAAEWELMADRLERNRTLTIVDDAALYQYAQLFAETEGIQADNAETRRLYVKLMKTITKKLTGKDLVDAVAEVVKLQGIISKSTQQLRQGHMAIRQYLVEFGMTPSARNRVKVPDEAPDRSPAANKLSRYLSVIDGGKRA